MLLGVFFRAFRAPCLVCTPGTSGAHAFLGALGVKIKGTGDPGDPGGPGDPYTITPAKMQDHQKILICTREREMGPAFATHYVGNEIPYFQTQTHIYKDFFQYNLLIPFGGAKGCAFFPWGLRGASSSFINRSIKIAEGWVIYMSGGLRPRGEPCVAQGGAEEENPERRGEGRLFVAPPPPPPGPARQKGVPPTP